VIIVLLHDDYYEYAPLDGTTINTRASKTKTKSLRSLHFQTCCILSAGKINDAVTMTDSKIGSNNKNNGAGKPCLKFLRSLFLTD